MKIFIFRISCGGIRKCLIHMCGCMGVSVTVREVLYNMKFPILMNFKVSHELATTLSVLLGK